MAKMKPTKKIEYIIVKEGFWNALITDTFTYLGFLAVVIASNEYAGGSLIIDIIGIALILVLARMVYRLTGGVRSDRFNSVDDAILYLNKVRGKK